MSERLWTHDEEQLASKMIADGEMTSYISAMTGHTNVSVINYRRRLQNRKVCASCGKEFDGFKINLDGICRKCERKSSWKENKDRAKTPGARVMFKTERTCCRCGKTLPTSEFAYLHRTCKKCEKAKREEKGLKARLRKERRDATQKHYSNLKEKKSRRDIEEFCKSQKAPEAQRGRPIKVHRICRTCKQCWLYPCFTGIDTMASNLALTCKSFRPRKGSEG